MSDDETRRLLRDLLAEVLAEASDGNGNGNGHHAGPVPQVPAPPTAAVLRPSSWDRPASPGEVIGNGAQAVPTPAPPAGEDPRPAEATEEVVIDTDVDLDRFVRSLLARFENPRDRMAIRAGTLRFTLRRDAAAPTAATVRIEKGAVTERRITEAAERGSRLVLGPGAVLTPLGRERARALGVEIERERRC